MSNSEREALIAASRLDVLRSAAAIGMSDIEAGRYQEFGASAELTRYLDCLMNQILSRRKRVETRDE